MELQEERTEAQVSEFWANPENYLRQEIGSPEKMLEIRADQKDYSAYTLLIKENHQSFTVCEFQSFILNNLDLFRNFENAKLSKVVYTLYFLG